MPIEPPPTPWRLPTRAELIAGDRTPPQGTGAADGPPAGDEEDDGRLGDLVAVGADLEPGTLLAAYRSGLFPMPHRRRRVDWWCPEHRGVLRLDDLRVSRSLRRSARDVEVRVDTAFAAVVEGCADPRRPDGWIDERIKRAYGALHDLGWAHSVETWRDGRLVGGLYGVALGGLFAGESMFHRERDASKVALLGLVELLRADGDAAPRLIDVQWSTPHLASLGVTEVPRATYLRLLPDLLAAPSPTALLEPPAPRA